MATFAIRHNPHSSRFSLALSDGQECFLEYRMEELSKKRRTSSDQISCSSPTTMNIIHTFVPEEHRGRRLAEALCNAAFNYAERNRLHVLASCSYVSQVFVPSNPRFHSICMPLSSTPSYIEIHSDESDDCDAKEEIEDQDLEEIEQERNKRLSDHMFELSRHQYRERIDQEPQNVWLRLRLARLLIRRVNEVCTESKESIGLIEEAESVYNRSLECYNQQSLQVDGIVAEQMKQISHDLEEIKEVYREIIDTNLVSNSS